MSAEAPAAAERPGPPSGYDRGDTRPLIGADAWESKEYTDLYLQPAGPTKAAVSLAGVLGNPVPIGMAAFVLSITPWSNYLMGWRGTTPTSTPAIDGSLYLFGGIGLFLAGILSWIIGNTFPSVFFVSLAGYFWFEAWILDPTKFTPPFASASSNNAQFLAGDALYYVWWAILACVFFIASFRVNASLVTLWFFFMMTQAMLAASNFWASYGTDSHHMRVASRFNVAAGAMAFISALAGWYILVSHLFTHVRLFPPAGLPLGYLGGERRGRT